MHTLQYSHNSNNITGITNLYESQQQKKKNCNDQNSRFTLKFSTLNFEKLIYKNLILICLSNFCCRRTSADCRLLNCRTLIVRHQGVREIQASEKCRHLSIRCADRFQLKVIKRIGASAYR